MSKIIVFIISFLYEIYFYFLYLYRLLTASYFTGKELLVLAADSAKFMVWANCAPPPAELGAMPSGARVVISISVIVRARELLSTAQHDQIKARVRALLESREIPVSLVLPPFTTSAAAATFAAGLLVLVLKLAHVL